MFGAEGFHQRFSQEDIFRNIDLGNIFKDMGFGGGDIFSQFFGTRGQGSNRPPFGQQGSGFDSKFDFNDRFRQGYMNQPTKGTDLDYELSLSLEEAASGGEKQVVYRGGKEKKEIKVKIPAGIADGQKLRLAGKGLSDIPGLPAGDLFFNIKIQNHPVFKREGNDLFTEKEIKFSEAVLGTYLDIPTMSRNKKMKIPAGTQSNTRMRLKGQGMPVFRGKGNGDLYIKLIISVPKKLTKAQKKLMQDMAKTGI
jgi:curved DNA-binding protein